MILKYQQYDSNERAIGENMFAEKMLNALNHSIEVRCFQ